jgi:ribokinase
MPDALLALVDTLILNWSEATLLCNMTIGDRSQAEVAAAALLELGVARVILTLGERGALMAEAGGATHIPVFHISPADTNAAGHAFLGAP